MNYSLYLIQNTRDNGELFYAEHGEIGGVSDAIGYDTPQHARKFHTLQEAQDFIDAQLPVTCPDSGPLQPGLGDCRDKLHSGIPDRKYWKETSASYSPSLSKLFLLTCYAVICPVFISWVDLLAPPS